MHVNMLRALRSPALKILFNFAEPSISLPLFDHGTVSFVASINVPRRTESLRVECLRCYSRLKDDGTFIRLFFKEKEMICFINSFNECLPR